MSGLHTQRKRNCDCGLCCEACGPHERYCMSEQDVPVRDVDPDPDRTIMEEVALEDGYMPRPHGITAPRTEVIGPLNIDGKA